MEEVRKRLCPFGAFSAKGRCRAILEGVQAPFSKLAAMAGIGFLVSLPGGAAPIWDKPTLSLGSLNLDGGLRQRFQLGVLSGSPEFAFPIFLEHGFRAEDPVSEYKIPQLETYVVPEGREHLLWLEPGGMRYLFRVSEIPASPPDKLTKPWTAVDTGAGSHEFHSNDGWVYRYEMGSLVSLTAPTGRQLLFQTEGLRISRIYQEAAGKEIILLEARENDFGQPESLRIGADHHAFTYSPESEQLIAWHSPRMGRTPVTFSYASNQLVETVKLPGGNELASTWGDRSGSWQKESGFELPPTDNGVFLTGDSDFKFEYGTTKAGINLMRTDALGVREGFVFNPLTRQLVRKNRDGGETTEFFGLRGASQNRLESARDAGGQETVRLSYDEKGRMLTRTVPGQAEVRFEYDDLDRITKVFRLNQLQKSYEYAGESRKPVKIVNALGDTIAIDYMPDGQVKRYQNLDGAVYEYLYDPLGQLVEEHHPMGYKRTIERDEFGRIVRIKEIDGRETRYRYSLENRLAGIEQDGSAWQYEYDPDGELTRLLRDGETWQKIEREQAADAGETILRETNSRGDETVFHFDEGGHLVRQVDALGQATRYKRDALGRLMGWEDASGAAVDFERDAFGRVAGVDTAESARLEMAYDLTGRIRRRNNGEQDTRFDYDKAGRLARIDYGKGQTIDYTYDDHGRVLTALTGQGVKTTYTWDALDRKTSERNEIPDIGFTLLEWTYTPSGRKKSIVIRKGKSAEEDGVLVQKTGYKYDALGRYTLISVNGQPKVWYDYDSASLRPLRKRFFNGWAIAYEYFESGYPKSIVAIDDQGRTITDCQYVWGGDGKLDQRILNGVHHSYRYDALGRLTEVVKSKDR